MQIAVNYQPSLYIFDGDWFCQHIAGSDTKHFTVDSINWQGEHTTYEEEYEACKSCGEQLND